MKTAFNQCADTTCPCTQSALPMLNLSEVGNLAIVAKLSESDKFYPAWKLLQNRKLCKTNFVLGLNNGYMEVLNA